MARLGNPLVYDLLETADILASQRGRMNLRKAAMRRAVSGAYYAVFHALCFMLVSEVRFWTQPNELLEPVYRLLDHATAKNRLTGRDAAATPIILQIGTNFADLQEARHRADYSPPALQVRHNETLNSIAVARQTVTLLENLPSEERKRLAVLLLARPRKT